MKMNSTLNIEATTLIIDLTTRQRHRRCFLKSANVILEQLPGTARMVNEPDLWTHSCKHSQFKDTHHYLLVPADHPAFDAISYNTGAKNLIGC